MVSVVIPAKDEAGNLPGLVGEIGAALGGVRFEIIVVDDGSSDDSVAAMKALGQENGALRILAHDQSCGQSHAVRSGLSVARGDVIVTIDGDGQNDPAFIPALLQALEQAGPEVGIAAGQRVGRKASWAKRRASKIANAVRGRILNDGTRDSGCGLKAVRRHVFERLPYFDGWHRFLPALVLREGYRVVHVDVVDRPRRHGQSKYGVWDRFWVGLLDLYGVWWLRQRRRRIALLREVPIARSDDALRTQDGVTTHGL